MSQIPKIIYPLLLRTTQKSYRRSDPLFKLERPRTTTTSVATNFKQPQITCRTCATHTHHHQKHEKIQIAKEGPIISAYQELIQRGEYRLDPAQLYTLQLLQALANDIHRYVQQVNAQPEEEQQSSGGWWSRVKSLVTQDPITAELQAPRGLYIWGGVGCGKTMLMDLFMHHVHDIDKTRVHFNSFMQSVHQQIHQYRTQHHVLKEDPLDYVVQQIRAQTQLLCFDEFQVTNIADAMLLGRLFDKLWQRHVIVVATSNRPPDDLYKGGLQRALFLPFIAQLKQRCHVHHMTSHVDYRLVGQRMKHIYHVISVQDPSVATQALEEQWNQLTEQRAGEVSEVSIGYGRVLRVKRALKGIAWFDFAELCDNKAALGVADYAKLCEVYHTLFIVNVPRMSPDTTLNEARRFILLIDECYDHKVKLIISARTAPEQLFPTSLPATASGGPITGEEEIFAFSRTLSRLHEMQTTEYLEQNHEPHPYHKKDEHHKRHVK